MCFESLHAITSDRNTPPPQGKGPNYAKLYPFRIKSCTVLYYTSYYPKQPNRLWEAVIRA